MSDALDNIRRAIDELDESNGDAAATLRALVTSETISNLSDRVYSLEQKIARLGEGVEVLEANPSLVWLFRFRTFQTISTVLIISFLLLILYLSGGLERLIGFL